MAGCVCGRRKGVPARTQPLPPCHISALSKHARHTHKQAHSSATACCTTCPCLVPVPGDVLAPAQATGAMAAADRPCGSLHVTGKQQWRKQ
jgi:hypothetical protein